MNKRKNVIEKQEIQYTFQPNGEIDYEKKIKIPKEMLKQIYQPGVNSIFTLLRENLNT